MINKIIDFYKQDLQSLDLKEFPISPMSAHLAETIHSVMEDNKGIMDGLDVGSGSGIQAAVLAHCGCKKVHSIDICHLAVDAAEKRIKSLYSSLLNGSKIATPQFKVKSLDDMSDEIYQYDIIVTNPPSYFTDCSALKTPMDFGLYDGSPEHAHDPEHSFLYKYFKQIVNPFLKPGGISICTWPGIEYRLVHDDNKLIVHPTAMLNKWFGWKFDLSAVPLWKDFFINEAPIKGSSRDGLFMREFNLHYGSKGCYSKLVIPPRSESNFFITFMYGILVLIRDENDKNSFKMEILPRKKIGENHV